MSSLNKVAIVTGGNKGIGTEIVKGLCRSFEGDVYLTSRDEGRGKETVSKLEKEGLKPKFHQLDIDSLESINRIKEYMSKNYGGIDVLVNNAGIAYKMNSTTPNAEQAKNTIRTNYFSTLNVCTLLFPLLRPNARVVNVSSSAGKASHIPNMDLQAKFTVKDLTVDTLSALMNQFVEDAEAGVQKAQGWAPSNYAMSKIGLTALTFIQQRDFDKDSREDLVINAVHPGYIATDMSSYKGPGTVEEGASAPLFCALLPHNVKEPRGQFIWNDKSIASWV